MPHLNFVDKLLGKHNHLTEFYFSDEFVRVLREEMLA